jgi:hypothetical protein
VLDHRFARQEDQGLSWKAGGSKTSRDQSYDAHPKPPRLLLARPPFESNEGYPKFIIDLK